eukprot:3004039-Pleurochrysis_carterae.AAC.2
MLISTAQKRFPASVKQKLERRQGEVKGLRSKKRGTSGEERNVSRRPRLRTRCNCIEASIECGTSSSCLLRIAWPGSGATRACARACHTPQISSGRDDESRTCDAHDDATSASANANAYNMAGACKGE